MKFWCLSIFFFIPYIIFCQIWKVEDLQVPMPEPVSNNAVIEGFQNEKAFVYSFGGIDESKSHDGIHLKSFRLDVENQTWESIDPLPDDMGKIAAGASVIGDTIYIIGGYHVFPNGSELSSNKVHRFSISQNIFLSDGADIPIPIDDHVQCVYKDRYIYIVTGWSQVTNVPDVQIYDIKNDSWIVGTSVPDNNVYKSFGASGAILNDTLYYFGGAAISGSFNIQNAARKTPLTMDNPAELFWEHAFYQEVGYRMACVSTEDAIHWIGGSNITYNFNGIAYNGTGGVAPNKQIISANEVDPFTQLITHENLDLPMDLRGIATLDDTTFVLLGGMEENQLVSDKTIKLTYSPSVVSGFQNNKSDPIETYPNPCGDQLFIKALTTLSQQSTFEVISHLGQRMELNMIDNYLDVKHLTAGLYYLKIESDYEILMCPFVKH